MTRTLTCLLMLSLLNTRFVTAEEALPDERLLRMARTSADEGDLRSALNTYFKVLRQSPLKENRSAAREYLLTLGLSGPEIFQLDPAVLKPADWEKLIARLSATRTQRQRESLDMEYALSLLQTAVLVQIGSSADVPLEGPSAEPDVHIDVQSSKELARALEILIQIALSPTTNENTRKAQATLERLGISGARVESVRTEAAQGKIAVDVQRELAVANGLDRLLIYKGWVEEIGVDIDRPRLGKRFGTALFKYLQKDFAQSPLFKTPSKTLDFWRNIGIPTRADDKF